MSGKKHINCPLKKIKNIFYLGDKMLMHFFDSKIFKIVYTVVTKQNRPLSLFQNRLPKISRMASKFFPDKFLAFYYFVKPLSRSLQCMIIND